MKLALAAFALALCVLGWRAYSMNATIGQQSQQIRELTAALADNSKH
jgi:hypothetical protein